MSAAPISVETARAAMVAHAALLPSEDCALDRAFGRVLAEDVTARGNQPPFDASAMDGWAVRAADAPGRLRIAGESAAGRGYAGALRPGEAVRVFTGAPVPDGADWVIVQEAAQAAEGFVTVSAPGSRHIRPRGLDFTAGRTVLRAGARLDGVALALAAAAGADPVRVRRAPRVAVFAMGDELAAPGGALGPDQIFESVSYGLAGLLAQWGAIASRAGFTGDSVEAIAAAMRAQAADADLIMAVGGASVGDHDLAKPAAARLGARLVAENVAVRPGRPTWFAVGAGAPILGLPGNPASALACAHLFLAPFLRAMTGREPGPAFFRAQLDAPLPANGPREHYLRARLFHDEQGQTRVRAFETQDSALLSVFHGADALIRQAARAPAAEAGALADVLALGRLD